MAGGAAWRRAKDFLLVRRQSEVDEETELRRRRERKSQGCDQTQASDLLLYTWVLSFSRLLNLIFGLSQLS